MDDIPISQLNPELPELETKQIHGVVNLIWPYSSSARQFAFLLSDPDFRRRRRNGQVRVRFSGSSARAIATTGVGIGDEVTLSLRGAEFIRENTAGTPGNSIDWELAYTQTLSSKIIREGKEVADLDLVGAAPTPAPRSPVRPRPSIESSHEWSSPAFLKRMRLSDVPNLKPRYDPLADDIEDGHAKKRRKRSYRDWNAWTYVGRTPSPEKEDADADMDGLKFANGSPSRPMQLPDTPVSPSKAQAVEIEDNPHGNSELASEGAIGDTVRDDEDSDLYAGPEGEEEAQKDHSFSEEGSEPDSEEEEISLNVQDIDQLENISISSADDADGAQSESESSEIIEVTSVNDELEADLNDFFNFAETSGHVETETGEIDDAQVSEVPDQTTRELSSNPIVLDGALEKPSEIVMPPPPTLSLLQTDFQASFKPGMLTPIGKEPSSPNLQPLDSSTLPMPSPFPGGEGNGTSYLDFVSSSQAPEQVEESKQELPDDEADYIMETSFYSSVSSSKAPAFQPTHESAFTDLRFTFGMDGATWSRPQTSSAVDKAFDASSTVPDENADVEYQEVENPEPDEAQVNAPIPANEEMDQSRDAPEPDDEPVSQIERSSIEPEMPQLEETADAVVLSSPVLDNEETDQSRVASPEPDEGPTPQIERSSNEPEIPQQGKTVDVVILSGSSEGGDVEPVGQPDVEMGEKYHSDGEQSTHNEVIQDLQIPSDAVFENDSPKLSEHHNEADDVVSQVEPVEPDGEPDVEMGEGHHSDGEESTHSEVVQDLQIPSDAVFDNDSSELSEQNNEADDAASQIEPAAEAEVSEKIENEATADPATQRSNAVSEVIDLGSSSDESDQEEELDPPNETAGKETLQEPVSTEISTDQTSSAKDKSTSRLKDVDAKEVQDKGQPPFPSEHNLSYEVEQSQSEYIKPEPTEDMETEEEMSMVPETLDFTVPDSSFVHQDVKMESIEDVFSSFIDEDGGQGEEEVSELLIAVPEEGNKLGELQTVAVPDTVPARNTRSKMKTSMSPEKEASVSSQTTRSRKRGSLAPLSQLSQRAISPPATRSRSIMSPNQDSFSTSPYSLRSQSKHLSPTKASIATPRRTSARQRSRQTMSSAEPSPMQESFTQDSRQTDSYNFPWTNFGPSQELGTLRNSQKSSQGKFASVPYVKDSEEGSLHSEGSLSTVQPPSDDWNMDSDLSDLVFPETPKRESRSTPRKAPAAIRGPTSPASTLPNLGGTPGKLASPFATQLPLNSPTKSAHSVASASVASSTPRRSRRINKDLADTRTDASMSDRQIPETILPADDEVAHTAIRASGDAVEMGGSPRPQHSFNESITAVEPGEQPSRLEQTGKPPVSSVNQQSTVPMTPEATQQTFEEPHPSFTVAETHPPTPELTQLRSSNSNALDSQDPTTRSPVTKSTPRRNATEMDVASPSTSPKPSVHSASDAEPAASDAEKPSVGLSTPIAYYTPLKDLPFFINRSSNFHSAGSPDVLALVTSSSTAPTRATKGPKHHTTTLHVTDLSVYPAQTTVQLFRAYATALPVAEAGDVVLLRSMNVRSLNRQPCLVSADESAWCVWRYGKPLWGKKRGRWGDVKSREEVKGPAVERGEGEWAEVEKLRRWWVEGVKGELEERVKRTRSKDKEDREQQETLSQQEASQFSQA